MPTYEYHCKDCSCNFDLSMTIAEKERREKEAPIACEQCGSNQVVQLIGGFSILTGAKVRQEEGGGSNCCGDGACC